MGSNPSRVRVTGPLGAYASGFALELIRVGYTQNATADQLRLFAHLSRWLGAEGLGAADLTPAVGDALLTARRAAGYTLWLSRKALRPLLEYLRELGVAPPEPAVVTTGGEALLDRFRQNLTSERGLACSTARGYVDMVRPFIRTRETSDGTLQTTDLVAADVTAFVVAEAPRRRVGSAKLLVTASRSLLAFLHVEGMLAHSLASAEPSLAGSRLAGLPKGLATGEVQLLLASCDRRTAVGRRDFAVLTMLVRLGLRAGEIVALEFGDIDWRSGDFLVVGKGNRRERLPLPVDVGLAMVDYLRAGRPGSDCRRVFLRTRAPHRALTSGGVTQIVIGAAQIGGASPAGGSPTPAHCGNRNAARRGVTEGDRTSTTAPQRAVDCHLRQGGPPGPERAGASVAIRRRGMIALRPALHDYLAVRRALGYKLQRTEKLLADFVAFVEASGNEEVTIDLALVWATLPAHGAMNWLAGRLTVVRGFATYVHTLDPATEVPPKDLLPARSHRAVPYLYSDSDIAALMHAAKSLASPSSVLTYQTLIPLLAVTGMRNGEAIRLDRRDIDLGTGVLTVRMSKFGKSRELPLHPSTVEALRFYLSERDQLHPSPNAPSLFVSAAGSRLIYCSVQRIFQRLVHQAGLVPRSTPCRPRLHDLRHSFAVRILTDAYRADADVAALLPRLSTYLGHGHPANTYWHLSAAPELLALAGQRLERSLQVQP